MKILIIEDEQSSADRLRRMLEPEHIIAGICASNAEVKAFFDENADVDLILSDIQLGDGLSFESLRTVPQSIPVIFTTAYDHFAVQAFRFNSIDYLLKPIDSQELRSALSKARQLSTTDAVAQLLDSVKNQAIRYPIRDGVLRLCTLAGRHHTLNMTLEDVESQLDPQRFMRVNHQFIINAAAVQKLSTYFLGKMCIHMTAAPHEEIIVSKDKVATVKRWLDF